MYTEKPPSQWTYIRHNQMYTTLSENGDTKPLTIIQRLQQQHQHYCVDSIIPYMNIHWVTSKIEYFCLFANWFAFPTNDHLIAKGLCNSIFCLYTQGNERIIVIVGIHEKGTICSTYGTILLSKMVSHLTLNYNGGRKDWCSLYNYVALLRN